MKATNILGISVNTEDKSVLKPGSLNTLYKFNKKVFFLVTFRKATAFTDQTTFFENESVRIGTFRTFGF